MHKLEKIILGTSLSIITGAGLGYELTNSFISSDEHLNARYQTCATHLGAKAITMAHLPAGCEKDDNGVITRSSTETVYKDGDANTASTHVLSYTLPAARDYRNENWTSDTIDYFLAVGSGLAIVVVGSVVTLAVAESQDRAERPQNPELSPAV